MAQHNRRTNEDSDEEGGEQVPEEVTVLRDLDLQEVRVVPTEEALPGCGFQLVGEAEFEFSTPIDIDPTRLHTEGSSNSPSTFEEREAREGWIPVTVEGFPCRVPEDVETVADLRDSLELDDEQTLLRIVDTDEEIAPGLTRQGVERLGDPEEPVVVGEGDAFYVEERDDTYPHTLPEEVAAFDADLFNRICNHLGKVGKLDNPARTTELDLRIRAGELVRVTHAAEDPLPEDEEE